VAERGSGPGVGCHGGPFVPRAPAATGGRTVEPTPDHG
jgi:hypothetical protein